MITLNRLIEKQEKMKKTVKKLRIFMYIIIALAIILLFLSNFIDKVEYLLMSLIVIFFATLISICINNVKITYVSRHIVGNIKRIFYSTVTSCFENMDVELMYEERDDDYLCFLAELYGKDITYNDLGVFASVLDPVADDIGETIHKQIIVYYNIDTKD